jgi:glycosyltransferase involved in cell wall biosynthesis
MSSPTTPIVMLVHAVGQAAGVDALQAFAREAGVRQVVCYSDHAAPSPGAAKAPSPTFQAVAAQAFMAAAVARAHLLIVRADVRPTLEALAAMAAVLDEDPLIGCVHARCTDPAGTRLLRPVVIDVDGDGAGPSHLPLSLATALPSFAFAPDHVSPCMLVPRRITGDLRPRSGHWTSLAGLLLDVAVRARRLGFRPVVANAALVSIASADDVTAAELPLAPADSKRLATDFPELGSVHSRLASHHALEDERTLAAAFESPESLLIDARNLSASVNGTSKAILKLAAAWHARRADQATTLWVDEAAAGFHHLEERLPGWRIHKVETPPQRVAAAVRLSQPWHVSDILSLHALAAVNVYLMLDTIAWDIAYAAPPGLDTVWRMAARAADGLVFISEFSRQRFLRRFALGPGVHTGVALLSMRPEDYVDASREAPVHPHDTWFVMGNTYDHKHVAPTVDTLARAFPTRDFVVLGDRHAMRGGRIRQLQSGRIPEAELQGLYASAGVVIFPSFYEGFGLPIINALAYGRTVLARASALLDELAAAYDGPGRLVAFQDEADLVEQLSRIVRGQPAAELRFGGAGRPLHGWDASAAAIEEVVRGLVAGLPSGQPRDARAFASALLRDASL